ncbi:phospholipase A [Idiomarina xiamenensis]|uniref:Phospholipase A1 n=1 Tax=Idiomarina xiamenensis 10-D-4 TaxID=740709 RepID=K2KC24_9GAMM|nr:phospholipase A [Idiomarina xiamenensis]EKE85413.1 outer membrane phospholipase A [Idiomarina xiamenensis 10-D-4]
MLKRTGMLLGLFLATSVQPLWAAQPQQVATQQQPENPYQQPLQEEEAELQQRLRLGQWGDDDGINEPALSINEPVYFIVGQDPFGDDDDIKARFQISFKYRMFSEDGYVADLLPVMKHFHLGYTQTSLWNLSADSKPFEDSSYRPSFFFEFDKVNDGWLPDFWRTGYEHESNGQAGEESRSIDMYYIQPAWTWDVGDRELMFAPKFYGYLTKGDENEDIDDYRGYVDMLVRYGHEDGVLASLTGRLGNAGKGSLQLDLSYPIREKIFSRAGGYIYLQLFHGYGDSFLTYDQKQDLQVRIGFAIVR